MTTCSVGATAFIRCRCCGARNFGVTARDLRDAVVMCRACGALVWTWSEFVELIEAILSAPVGQLSNHLIPSGKKSRSPNRIGRGAMAETG